MFTKLFKSFFFPFFFIIISLFQKIGAHWHFFYTFDFSQLSWVNNGSGKGFSLEYPHIALHAISRDLQTYPQECLYMMLDSKLPADGNFFIWLTNWETPQMYRFIILHPFILSRAELNNLIFDKKIFCMQGQ